MIPCPPSRPERAPRGERGTLAVAGILTAATLAMAIVNDMASVQLTPRLVESAFLISSITAWGVVADRIRRRDVRRARTEALERLNLELTNRVRELNDSLERVRKLEGLLPMCTYCKKIRDDRNYWQQVEVYISLRSETRFSHGVCPSCYDQILAPKLEKMEGDARA